MDIGNVIYLRMQRGLEETPRARTISAVDEITSYQGSQAAAKNQEEDDAALVKFSADYDRPNLETYSRGGTVPAAFQPEETLPVVADDTEALPTAEEAFMPASFTTPPEDKGALIDLVA